MVGSVGERIRSLRRRRGISQRVLADLAGYSTSYLQKLEAGARPLDSLSVAGRIAEALGVQVGELLGGTVEVKPRAPEDDLGMDPVELMRRAERSDVGGDTLDTIDATVDRLCRDYAREPAGVLLVKVRRRLRYVVGLLSGRTRLDEHRRLLAAAGWLAVLRSVLEFDVRNRGAADASRDLALRLGVQAGHPEIVAWSFEVEAWWALVDERWRDAVDLSRKGQAAAPRASSAMVQLTVQEARAWARIGDRREAPAALKRGAVALAALPIPEHSEHHFVFDASKLSFYSGTIYAWLGMSGPAEEHALDVIAECGDGRWSTRVANSWVDVGLARLHRGEVDGATEAGQRALSMFDRPPSATLWRAADLHRGLRPFGDVAEVRDWRDRYLTARR